MGGRMSSFVEQVRGGVYHLSFVFSDQGSQLWVKRLDYEFPNELDADYLKESITEYVRHLPPERVVGVETGLSLAAHVQFYIERIGHIPVKVSGK